MRTFYLRTLRIQRRLSQEDLARLSEVAQNTISKLETNAHSRPSAMTVFALARVLTVAPETLRFGPDPKHLRTRQQKSTAEVVS